MKHTMPGEQPKDLIDRGFDLDKRVNHALIVAGLGIAAIGSVMVAPAAAIFGATVAGGSVAGLAVTENLKGGYESMKAKRAAKKMGAKVTRDNFALAA